MFQPIPLDEFVVRTGLRAERDLGHAWENVRQVVSLRQLASIDAIELMNLDYLRKLLDNVTVGGGNGPKIYDQCEIRVIAVSPRASSIGQTFVERKKYTAMLEQFAPLLERFALAGGVGSVGAFVALGKLKDGTPAIAHYVPPIIEVAADGTWTVLDGIHRNFVVERIGATTPAILIKGVQTPLPFERRDWNQIRPVDTKPDLEDRYFKLDHGLFRDLKRVGIDG